MPSKVYVTDSGTKTRRIRAMSVPEQHRLNVAKKVLATNDAINGVMGGMTRIEAAKVAKVKATKKREQYEGINPDVAPSGAGCVECLKSGKGWWLHLRRCAECGHVGCCDNSPMKHATAHFHIEHHPIVQSYEPGETWFFDYRSGQAIKPDVRLKDPQSHPFDQPIPFYVGKDKTGISE